MSDHEMPSSIIDRMRALYSFSHTFFSLSSFAYVEKKTSIGVSGERGGRKRKEAGREDGGEKGGGG